MGKFDANEVINGLHGHVYDESGVELSTTQEFEAVVEFDKEEIKQAGKFMTSHKVKSGSGSGSIMFLKIDSRLQKKIADDPTGKYNYIGHLADPDAKGHEKVLLRGVSFDQTQLQSWNLDDLSEVELDFTFDDFEYLRPIESFA